MGTFSIWHWLIVLVIILLVFGTKKLRNLGSDLGGAVKGFKDGVREAGDKPAEPGATNPAATATTSAAAAQQVTDRTTIDVEAREKTRT